LLVLYKYSIQYCPCGLYLPGPAPPSTPSRRHCLLLREGKMDDWEGQRSGRGEGRGREGRGGGRGEEKDFRAFPQFHICHYTKN